MIRCGEKDGERFSEERCYPKILTLCGASSVADEGVRESQAMAYYLSDKIENDLQDNGDPYLKDYSAILTSLCEKYYRRYKAKLFGEDADKVNSLSPFQVCYADGSVETMSRRLAGFSISALHQFKNPCLVNADTFSFLMNGRDMEYHFGLMSCFSTPDKSVICSVLSLQKGEDTALVGLKESFRFQHPIVSENQEVDRYLANIQVYANVFGGILCFFSAFLMGNFVGLSIERRKKDIGILRSLGARGIDVFLIYSLEGIMVSLFAYALAIPANFALSYCANESLKKALSVTVEIIVPGLRQAGLLLLLAITVALVASFFPIRHFTKKKPGEIIGRE